MRKFLFPVQATKKLGEKFEISQSAFVFLITHTNTQRGGISKDNIIPFKERLLFRYRTETLEMMRGRILTVP